jgi:hypothetical protein
MSRLVETLQRHCEERSDEAIHLLVTQSVAAMDCFATLAMTVFSFVFTANRRQNWR